MTAIISAGQTHTGFVREGNEDSWYADERLLVVADGLGGHAAGDVASQIAVERVAATGVDGAAAEVVAQRLVDAVADASQAVHADARDNPERAGMGTTLTAVAVVDGALVGAHVGDSRAYLLRDGALTQLSADHTAAEEAVRAGLLRRDEAEDHPSSHTLTRAVGLDPDVEIDRLEALPLAGGDRVLLCSDGLTGPVSDERIARLLADGQVSDVCERLVEAALAQGAPDNVTVVVAVAS